MGILIFLLVIFSPAYSYKWVDLENKKGGVVLVLDEVVIADAGSGELISTNGFRMTWPNISDGDDMVACDLIGGIAAEIAYADVPSGVLSIITPATKNVVFRENIGFQRGDSIECGDVDGDSVNELIYVKESGRVVILEVAVSPTDKSKIALVEEHMTSIPQFSRGDSIAVGNARCDREDIEEIVHLRSKDNTIAIYRINTRYGGLIKVAEIQLRSPQLNLDILPGDDITVGRRCWDSMVFIGGGRQISPVSMIVVGSQKNESLIGIKLKEDQGGIFHTSVDISERGTYKRGDELSIGDLTRHFSYYLDAPLLRLRKGLEVRYTWPIYRGVIHIPFSHTSMIQTVNPLIMTVGDIDGNSIVVADPIKGSASFNSTFAVVNSPPKDKDAMNEDTEFYVTFNAKTDLWLRSVVFFTSEIHNPYNRVPVFIRILSQRHRLGHLLPPDVKNKIDVRVKAENEDKMVILEEFFDAYEFPIINPQDLATMNGKQQYLLLLTPTGDLNVHLTKYSSPLHQLGDIKTYPSRPQEAASVLRIIFPWRTYNITRFNVSSFPYSNTYTSQIHYSGAIIPYFEWVQFHPENLSGEYLRQEGLTYTILTPLPSSENFTLSLFYSGGLEESKKYETVLVEYGRPWSNFMYFDFLVTNMSEYYRTRQRSPLGFNYDLLSDLNKPNVPSWIPLLFEMDCKVGAKPKTGKSPLLTKIFTKIEGRWNVRNWTLSFGDGDSVSGFGKPPMEFLHEYYSGGEYEISLHAEDVFGSKTNCSFQLNVSENRKPKAKFSVSPEKPERGQIVHFTDMSSDDGSIDRWVWNFGDGATSTERNPTHRYSLPGHYTVILVVEDDGGYSSSYSKDIEVIPFNEPPMADFKYSPKEPKTGETVRFKDASRDLDGVIVSWEWDFGDGRISTEKDPTHIYTIPGSYTVMLVVRDNAGKSGKVTKVITVSGTEEGLTSATTTETVNSTTYSLPETKTSESPPQSHTCGVGTILVLAILTLKTKRMK